MIKDFQCSKNRLVISFCGEIDEFASRSLRVELDDLIERYRARQVVFDFKDVAFVDSTGIGLVIGRYKNSRNFGVELLLQNVPNNIDRIFKSCGLYKYIPKVG